MTPPSPATIVVIKVGGSLYDWPELGQRLPQFLATIRGRSIVLVPGGGPFADVVRKLDQIHRLNEETAHWLALNSLILSARFLEQVVPAAKFIDGLSAARNHWMVDRVSILNMFRFARGDETRPNHLTHTWSATSDSFAVRVAIVANAERLILLKSTSLPPGTDWNEAARTNYVDALFPSTVTGASFPIEAVNLRDWQPSS